jgi:hypothetical protein
MRRPRTVRATWLDNPLTPLYAYMAAIGYLTATEDVVPATVQQSTPQWLTVAWAGSLAIAGLLTLAGCVTDRNRLEAAGLALWLFGLGLLTLAEVTRGELGDDVLAVAALTGCAYLRLRVLRKARRAVKHVRRELQAGGPCAH